MVKRLAKSPFAFGKKRPAILAVSVAALLVVASGAPARAQLTNPITTTPIILDVNGFGPAGDLLPAAGGQYCVPTSTAEVLSYLGLNGFNQLAPAVPTAASEFNLVQVLSGLMDTDPLGGTGTQGLIGIQTYLAAEGISTANYTSPLTSPPANVTPVTVSQMAALLNAPDTVVLLGIAFTNPDGSPNAGHFVALVGTGVNALGQPSPNTIIVDDEEPVATGPNADVPGNALQYLSTILTTGVFSSVGEIEINPSEYGSYNPATTVVGVINTAIGITINPSQLSVNNPTPAPWNLTGTQYINLNGGTLPVLAPITGTGGITLGDYIYAGNSFTVAFGTLQSQAPDTSTGPNEIDSGTWISTITSGQPFGTGSFIVLQGTLALSPAGGSSSLNFSAANGSGNTFGYGDGTEIALNLNGNTSLTFTIGGNTDGSTANLLRYNAGTLVISVGGGVGDLGQDERLIINGSGGNLPPLTNGIVSPSIVEQNGDGSGGDFLTYGSNGFARAAYTSGSVTPISSAGSNAVFLADVNQTVPGNTTAQVYALNAGSATVGGGNGSVLEVGPQSGGQAGVILNGGTISTPTLAFGSAEGLVYTSNAGGVISSVITGSGGLTTFGPGTLTLQGANSYSGPTNINSGTLQAQNTSGSATGSGDINVNTGATLEISGAPAQAGGAGTTTVNTGAALLLNGGTLAGNLTTNSGSYLFGKGTISGPAAISGVIGNSGTPSQLPNYTGVEDITFNGSTTFTTSTVYSWKLNALDANPADAGTNWSLLTFNGPFQTTTTGGNADSYTILLDLGSTVPDPNSGNAFWNTSHQWEIEDFVGSANVSYGFGAPAYSQGSFSIMQSGSNIDVEYVPNTMYWLGGYGVRVNNVFEQVWDGHPTSNWAYGVTSTRASSIPGNATDVIFSAAGATGENDTFLGQDFTIHSLTVIDTVPVVINNGTGGPYTLTIAGLSGTGITVGIGSTLTINANVTLAGDSDTIAVANTGVATINGVLGGINGVNKYGSGTLTLSGANTYTGPMTVAEGMLQFSQEVSLYSNQPGNWTAANITVQPGATLALNVGGPGEFTSADVAAISALRTLTGGFQGGSVLGLDTTNAAGGNFVYNGVIADTDGGGNSLGLTKLGAGTLTLTNANTYTGPTTVNSGMLQFAQEVSLYNNNLARWTVANITVQPGATLALNVGGPGDFTSADVAAISALGTNSGGFQSGSFLGLDTTNAAGGNFVYNGVIADTNGGANPLGLTKLGTGTLTLTNVNTYTGATTVSGGMLQFAQEVSLYNNQQGNWTVANITVQPGATLALNVGDPGEFTSADVAAVSALGTLTGGFQGGSLLGLDTTNAVGGSFVYNGVIADTNGGANSLGLTKLGAGTLTLTNANTYTGATNVNAGTLNFTAVAAGGAAQPLGEGSAVNLGVAGTSSGTLNYTGAGGTLDKAVNILGNGGDTIQNSGSGLLTLAGNVTIYGAALNLSDYGNGMNVTGPIRDSGSDGGLNIVGTIGGTVTLSNISTYTGPTNIYGGVLAGVLQAGSTTGFSPDSAFILVNPGTVLDLNGYSNTIGSLADGFPGSGIVTNSGARPATLTTGNDGTSTTFSGVIEDGASQLSMVKIGGGAQTLAGLDTYTGTTSINAGTLTITTVDISTNPQSLGEGNTVNLGVAGTSSGTLNYTGTGGTMDKNFNVLGNGGDTIQNSGSGVLTLTGNITIHGTTLNFNSNGYYIDVGGPIGESSPGSAVTIQAGSVFLDGINSYTGATTIDPGASLEASVAALGKTSMINLGSALGYGNLYTDNGGNLNKNIDDLYYGQIVATGTIPLNLSGTVTIATNGVLSSNSYLSDSRNPGGGLIISGLIQGQGSLQIVEGSVTLTNNNTFSGPVNVYGGIVNFSTMAAGAAPQPLGEYSQIGLGSNNGTLNYTGNGGTLDKSIYVTGNGILQNSGSGLLTLTGNVNISGDGNIPGTLGFNDNGSGIQVSGVVSGSDLTVLGGVVTLTNANTYFGATTINAAGRLNLGGGGATGSLNSSSSLILNGGTFSYNVTGNATQTLAGLTINAGASTVAVAAGDALDLRYADIARFLGGTVDFSGPGMVLAYPLTSGNNNVVVDDNGTAYATVNGVDWASNNPAAAAIGALRVTGAYQTGASSYVMGNDIDVGASTADRADSPAANFIVNTLRFNASGLTLKLAGAYNTLSAGGILVTNAGISDGIDGGTIQSGLGRELVIINNGSLIVFSVIADSSSGSSALTISGTGKLTLGGQNTYTGITTLSNGIVNLASAENPGVSGPLGASAAANPGSIVFAGGTLQYSAANQNDYSGRFSTDPNQNISIDTNGQTVTFATALTSPGGSLTLTDCNFGSPGTLILTGANSYTGPTTINGGTLELGDGAGGLYGAISESSHLVLGGGTLGVNNSYPIFNGATVNTGASAVTAAAGTVYLGNITRDAGGTVDFSGPGTITGTASVSGVNNVLVSANGTAFATVNGVDWATSTLIYHTYGSLLGIGALSATGAYQTGAGSYLAGNDIDVGASTANTTDTPTANFTVNTLRFNASGLTLALSGANTVSTGGILVPSAGIWDSISGGTLRSGGGQEMVIINNGSLNISAVIADSISGTSALTASGAGTLTLSGQNTYTGVTRLNGGIVNLGNAENPGASGPLGNSPASNPGSIVFDGGTLQYSAANQNDYSGRFSTAASQRISIDTNGQTVTFATALTSVGGSLTLTDGNFGSPGTLILTGANTYTGPTTIGNGSTLDIGGGGATGSISTASPLVLGGGTLIYTETGNTTQAFNGTTINSGDSAVTVAAGDTVNLIAITRNVGATVDFSGPGAVAGNAAVSGVNNVPVSANGTAFATVNGADWATGTAGSIGALSNSGAYQTGAGNYVAGNDIDVGASIASTTDTPAANFTVNTLRFNASGLTLALSGANTVGTGGILVTSAGVSGSICGGTLQPGGGQEMVIINNGSLNVCAAIADSISGPSALTVSGAGTLTLSGQNTYTGVTTLNGGIVNLGSGEYPGTSGPLGNSPASNPGSIVFNGGTLQYSTYNQNDYSGRFSTAPNQRISIDTNGQTVTFATALTSVGGSLTLTDSDTASPGDLYLAAANTYTGATSINAGTLSIATVATGATAQSLGEGTTVNLGVANTSSGTLNYFGNGGTLDKAINVLGNGNDTIQNAGGPLTLSGNVTIYGTTLNFFNDSGSGINVTGVIGDRGAPGSLNAVGGMVTLSNANTYTGATTAYAGTLQFAREVSLYNNQRGSWTAANITVMNEATLALNVGGPGEFTSADVAAISALGSNTGGFQGGSVLGLDTTDAAGGNFVYHGVIADTNGGANSLGLTKLGTGTLTLTSANTYSGPTTIIAGTLALTGSGTLGSGALDIAGGSLSANSVAALAGVSSITLGSATTSGTLTIPGGATLNADVTVGGAGGGMIDNTGGGTLTLAGTLTKDGNVLTLSGGTIIVTGQIVGALPGSDLVVNNGTVVTLTNANNSYNGPTYVNGSGMLLNGVTNALPPGTDLTLGEAIGNTGGTYDLNGFDASIAGLSNAGHGSNTVTNSGAGGTNTLTVTGSGTFGGTIQDGGHAKTALTKSGSGTQTLDGINTYTGATNVGGSGSKLVVNGSIAASSGVLVSLGATLSGHGAVSAISGAGLIAPGDPQILTATQVDPSGGLSFAFSLTQPGSPTYSGAGASGNDVLHLTSSTAFIFALTSANAVTLDFSGATLEAGQTYLGGFFTDASVPDSMVADASFGFTGTDGADVQYEGLFTEPSANFATGTVTDGKVMEFEVISTPEPGSAGLLLFGGLGLLASRRRAPLQPESAGEWSGGKRPYGKENS